jgi:single-stranded-DNA-specific exonuclease
VAEAAEISDPCVRTDASSSARPARARWRAQPYSYADAHTLAREFGLSATTAAVLVRRGIRDVSSARRFLEAADSHDPFEFRGMDGVVELVLEHVRRGSVITVHGDYDVDGICSTALGIRALQTLGANVRARLPHRTEDGYGLSSLTVEQLRRQGTGLLLTADCGIGAVAEVALARRLGMDVVVTDHHRPAAELPDCPIVHPGVCGYPFPDLCATGVVYKLAQALFAAAGRDAGELEEELDLVALATVADVVPLLGENRALVRNGLRVLAATAKPGLRALMKVAGTEPQALNERALGFALAPRMNAAGRIERADAGLELLLTGDSDRALQIARELDALNSERQAIETRILFEAERQLSDSGDQREDPLYVLAAHGWHPGVIGIVASRLVKRYHRPCVLVALDEEGRGRGSGRSIAAYDLHAGLAACASLLARFGGHRMAAGLEIAQGDLDRFRTELVAHARSSLSQEDLVRVERVDAVVPGDVVGMNLAEELDLLRPFGMGNPAVNLLVPAAQVSDVRPMGEGRHARFTVSSAGVRARAVAFGVGGGLAGDHHAQRRHDLVARLEANEWQGAVEPRLVLQSLHPVEPDPAAQGENGCRGEEDAAQGCAACACRARGSEWWKAVLLELDTDVAQVETAAARGAFSHRLGTEGEEMTGTGLRTVVDRRGGGVLGAIGDLLSTGETVLVACADVSRRRYLLERELDPSRFSCPSAVALSARCTPRTLDESSGIGSECPFVLADYATIAAEPSLLGRFSHVFALEPPPFRRIGALLADSAGRNGGPGFLHLGWGAAEVDLARRVLEQEYGLRGTLAAVYRALARRQEGEEVEALLAGTGRHPRSPAAVGRCLRVLAELGLAELGRSSATVKCTIIGDRRVDLEHSATFVAYTRIYQEGLRFLSEQAQTGMQARAA